MNAGDKVKVRISNKCKTYNFLTKGKIYDAIVFHVCKDKFYFYTHNDKGWDIVCISKKCAHLHNSNWILVK